MFGGRQNIVTRWLPNGFLAELLVYCQEGCDEVLEEIYVKGFVE